MRVVRSTEKNPFPSFRMASPEFYLPWFPSTCKTLPTDPNPETHSWKSSLNNVQSVDIQVSAVFLTDHSDFSWVQLRGSGGILFAVDRALLVHSESEWNIWIFAHLCRGQILKYPSNSNPSCPLLSSITPNLCFITQWKSYASEKQRS